jgi:hypothetical protein
MKLLDDALNIFLTCTNVSPCWLGNSPIFICFSYISKIGVVRLHETLSLL